MQWAWTERVSRLILSVLFLTLAVLQVLFGKRM